MDIMQKVHKDDLLLCQIKFPSGEVQLARRWMRREKYWILMGYHDLEVVQTAAYGTEDWKVAHATVMS